MPQILNPQRENHNEIRAEEDNSHVGKPLPILFPKIKFFFKKMSFENKGRKALTNCLFTLCKMVNFG